MKKGIGICIMVFLSLSAALCPTGAKGQEKSQITDQPWHNWVQLKRLLDGA